jgi:hypothetical protein
MYKSNIRRLAFGLASMAVVLLATAKTSAQCTELIAGLHKPLGSALTNRGNLLVSESGTGAQGSGRISIVDPSGNRRTLIDGLPSGISDVGSPLGPAGLFMSGRTLYVAMSAGDVVIAGPCPGSDRPNPNGPSSPIFSSVLAIQFSATVEQSTTGFTLTPADEQALADHQTVTLSNDSGQITIRMVANFPDYIPFPIPCFPDNVLHSNPFQLVAVEDTLYVTDGGRNLAWAVDLLTESFSPLVAFPNIPNPLYPAVGGPFLQAVPTGIAAFDDQLLVTLFRGGPFPTGVSTVEQIDPTTGGDTPLITGRTDAIGIRPMKTRGATSYLVLQYASAGPFFQGPGLVLRFDDPVGPPTVIANCLTHPTSMTLNERTGKLYVTEEAGRVVAISFAPTRPVRP